jgi:hypothetical protein
MFLLQSSATFTHPDSYRDFVSFAVNGFGFHIDLSPEL